MDPWPERIQQRLKDVKIYNEDGSVNKETAEALGWAEQWRADEASRAEAAQRRRALPTSEQKPLR